MPAQMWCCISFPNMRPQTISPVDVRGGPLDVVETVPVVRVIFQVPLTLFHIR